MKTGLKYAVLGLALLSAGWFANDAIRPEKAFAAKTLEYKVVGVSGVTLSDTEKTLNDFAQKGWRYHSIAINFFVFER